VFSTIRARLYLLVVLALLPAIAILVYDEVQLRRRALAKVREDAVRVIMLMRNEFDAMVDGTQAQFRLLARMPEVRAMDATANPRLAEVLGDEPDYTFEGTRALLAEDNEANQMVATELLARLGIELDIAGNGRAAVEMARQHRGRYAAILMDMQMPEMDGLEATRALRADPEFRDLPIIAMTANAMKHDLDACLAAGMNDHVTKPIDRRALLETLRRWLPRRATAAAATTPATVPAGLPDAGSGEAASLPVLEGIDVEGAVRRLGLPFDVLRKMLIRFADGQRQTFDELRAAVETGDPVGAARHAHAIAGSARNLGAESLREAAKALEKAGRDGQAELGELYRVVEEHAAVVFRSIDSLRAPPESGAQPAAAAAAPVDPVKLRGALERLRAALADFDLSETSETLGGLREMGAPGDLAGDLARVEELAEGYEYDAAAGIVARLLDDLAPEPPR